MFGRTVVGISRRLISLNSAMRLAKLVGVTLATRYALKFADAIVVTARKVGLTNKELISLQFTAGLAGIKIGDLTKHLERMVPKLGTIQEALKGLGVKGGDLELMGQVIEKLGLSMTQLQGKAVQEAVAVVRRLWTVIKAVSLELAVRLAPAVKFVAKELLHFVVMARIAVVELAQRLEPYINSASERLVQFATAGANAGTTMPRSFGLIAEAGAKLANSLVFMETAWHGLNSVILKVSSSALGGFDAMLQGLRFFLGEVVKGIETLFPLLPAGFLPVEWKELLNAAREYEKIAMRTQQKVSDLADTLASDAGEAIRNMNEAWDRFTAGKAGEDFKAVFKDIAERAAEVVAQILKLQKIGLKIPDIPKKEKKTRIPEFQQVSLARMAVQAVGTPSRPQVITSPQLETTNEHLRQLRTLMIGVGLTY